MMQRISLVEKVGSGINRIRDTMSEANLPAPKFEIGGFFTVTFYRPVPFAVWIKGGEAVLKQSVIKLLQAMKEDEMVTKKQLSSLLGQGKTSIDNHINKLRSLGLLKRIGSDKTSKWVIHQIPPPVKSGW